MSLSARLAALARDLAGLAGAGLVAYGAWLVYRPAGFIAGGVLLIAASILLARGD
jgi:ABC-type protease/lipase transport system fused ATPase/permease subunit